VAGLFTVGAVLALMGLAIMSGLMTTLIDVTGIVLIIGGTVASVAGGAFMLFGSALSRVLGAGLMMVGIAVAIMGLIMKFVLDLWIIHWLIDFGGVAMLIMGIIVAALGLIGMLRGAVKKELSGQ
jgi:hypothetical protein